MTRSILVAIFLLSTMVVGTCQDLGKGSADGLKDSGSGETGNKEAAPVRTACKDEIEKLCAGEQKAGRCLRERDSANLSAACRLALTNRETTHR